MLKNKGITLIALVVTIIVLLILAGVSITAVFGDNGIISGAQKAKEKTDEAVKNERKDLTELFDELDSMLTGGEATKVTDSTPKELAGKGTEEEPYLIESIEDLVTFSNNVNEGNSYEEKVVKLGINLDFNSTLSYVDYTRTDYGDINKASGTEELKTELTTGGGFIPIGNNNHQFKGSFDGGAHTIKNLYINEEESNYMGLFGYCGDKSSIKNIVISNVNITSTKNYVGGLVGRNYGTIDRVKTEGGEITAKKYVGGIVGDTKQEGNKVTSCNNDGEITGKRHVGGIAGYSEKSIVDNCNNNGMIIGDGVLSSEDSQYHVDAGGIVGYATSQSEIRNSHNYNEVKTIAETGKTKIIVGGIVGLANTNSTIYNCYNEGKIGTLENGIEQVGGISGALGSESTIKQCYNKKEINGQRYVGGIAGLTGYLSTSTIDNCYNTGEVKGITNNIGGICYVHSNTTGTTITNCYNTGNVSATNKGNNTYIRRNCRNRKFRKYNSYKLLLFRRYMRRCSKFTRYK